MLLTNVSSNAPFKFRSLQVYIRRLTCSGIWSPLFHRPFFHPRSLYPSIPVLGCAKIPFAILLLGCKMSFSILTAEGKAPPSDIPHAQKQNASRFLVLSPTQSASCEQPLPPSKASGIQSPSTAAFQAASAKAITVLSSLPAEKSVVRETCRSSGVRTTNSDIIEKKQFLRLGPVQSGVKPSNSAYV